MRKLLAKEFEKILSKDPLVFILYGDVAFPGLDELERKYPRRILNIGIMEQTMVSFAAGMALGGFKVYVYTITPFLIERAFEQIKLDINTTKLDVNLIGWTNYNHSGPTHEELNAKTIMSLFTNIQSYYPETEEEVIEAVSKSYETKTPTFIKLKNYARV